MKNKQCLRFIMLMMIWTSSSSTLWAQQSGEIKDTEVIIEKDKPLTLPKANRYYQPTDISSNSSYESPAVNYSFSDVQYDPADYQPNLKYKPYSVDQTIKSYENFIKAAYGNYGSPLLEGQYLLKQDEHYLKAYTRHLSFGKGPVRDEKSAFADSQVKLNGHLDGDINYDPFISWQQQRYFFYGRDDANDIFNPLIVDDRIVLQHLMMGVTVKLDPVSQFEFEATPSFRNTFNKVAGGQKFAKESDLKFDGSAQFHPIDELTFGLGLNLEKLKYESVYLLNRTKLQLNPYVAYESSDVRIHGGFQMALANDSTGGQSTTHLYPDVDINLKVVNGLTLYGSLSGSLDLTSIYSLSKENRYLENALPLLNQNNKLGIKAGVRTRMIGQLFLDASLGYDVIDNLPFFVHSLTDSSRFTLAYDSSSLARTDLAIRLGYFAGDQFSLNYAFNYYGYSMDTLQYPWYKPTGVMEIMAKYRPLKQLSVQWTGSVLGGIVAPSPSDGSPVDLPGIFDMGLALEYNILENAAMQASVQNLLSKTYERYLNYPSMGISFKLGFIYRI